MTSLEPAFRRSSYSNGGGTNCLEAGLGIGQDVVIRDSKDCQGPFGAYPTLAISRESWQRFTSEIKTNHFA